MKTRVLKYLLVAFCLLTFAQASKAQVLTGTNNASGLTSGNIYYGQTGIALSGINFSATSIAAVNLTTVTFTSTQNIANYMPLANFKLYRSSGSTYSTSTITPVTGTITFPSTTTVRVALAETIPAGTTVTYYLVADYLANGATGVTIKFTPTAATASNALAPTLSLAGGNTLTIGRPVITIGGLNSTSTNGISPTTIAYGQTDITMFGFTINATVNSTTVSKVVLNATTATAAYFSTGSFTLYQNSGTNYGTGTNTPVPGASVLVSGSTITISGMSESFIPGQTNSYFLVGDYDTNGVTAATETFSLQNNQTTFTVGNGSTSTTTTGGTVTGSTFNMPLPVVTIGSLNSTSTNGISPTTITQGQTGIAMFGFSINVTTNPTTVSAVTISSATTNNQVTNYFGTSTFKLYRNSGTNYTTGTNTLVPGASIVASGTTVTITGMSEAFALGQTNNYFLVADYSANGSLAATETFSLPNNTVTFSKGVGTSTTTTGGTITGSTFNMPAPTVTIGGLNSPTTNGISAANIGYGQTGIAMFGFTVNVANAGTTLKGFNLNDSQTPSNYFSNFKLYRSSTTNYTTGTLTPVTATFNVTGNPITVSGMSEAFTAGQTNNYFVVADYTVAGSVPGTEQYTLNDNNLSYLSGSASATATTGGALAGQTFNMVAPTITFTGINNIGTGAGGNGISPTSIVYGQTGIVMYGFSLTDSGSPTTVSSVNLGTTNNPIAQFFSNFKVYSSPTSTFDITTATLVSTTLSPSSGNSAFNITGFNQALTLNQTKYYFITADWTNNQGNVLPTSIKFDYSDMAFTTTNTIKATSNTTGQTFPLGVPTLTITNSTTGVYTGTNVAAGGTYNLMGFTLTPSGPTNLHELTLDLNYPLGGDNFTSGYVNTGGVQLIDASTGSVATGVTGINVNGNNITIEFSLYSLNAAKSYYLKVPFNSDWSVHKPTAFQICLNSSSNINSNVCGNNSNCTVDNQYSNLTGSSCSTTYTPPSAPTVLTTTPVTNIYGGTGTVGGSITSTGGATVTEYGIVYSTAAQSTNPTVANSKFVMGSGATGATTYSDPLQGLAPNTTYYVRAYAINSVGTSYGVTTSFTTLAAPNITYVTPQTVALGAAITPISPTNTGGAIPARTYGAYTTFASGLSNYFMAFDAAGNLYEADASSVIKITPAGVKSTLASGFSANSPTGVAVDPSGNVYLSSTSNIIYKITPTGTVSNFISSGLSSPYGLVFDNAGNLYIANSGTNTILKVAYGTTTLTTYATGFNQPYGLAIDATGKLWESDRSGNKIYSIVGGTKTQIGGTMTQPTGIALAADGSIFFASLNTTDNIYVIPSGSTTPSSILSGSPLNNPRNIILDNTGEYLYISNTDAGTILSQSVTGYTYTGTLPAGLSFDYTTGTVSGTPTAYTSATGNTITVTGYNSAGNSVTTLTIIVSPAPPTVTGTTTLCGAQTTSLTAAGGTPAGGTYNWYTAATGGTAVASTATYSPFIGGTTTLYVSYTSGAATSARTAVTVTVNQKFSSSINTPMLSYPFESGSLTDWSGLANNGTLQGTTLPVTTTDRNGIANGAYQFSGTNASPQYISTTTQYDPLVYSYSIWFKTTTAGGKLIGIGGNQTGSNPTQDRNLYIGSTGQLFYGVYNGGTVYINTTTTYIDGLWHHAVVTDGPTYGMRIYVDGTLQAFTNTYTTPQQINEYWRIGGDNLSGWPSRPTNDYFVGTLDDVAIYNHELTPTEAASNDMNLYSFSSGYCANNPLTVTAQTLPGATYSWVDNATPTLTGTGNPVTFSNATATNYTLTTIVNGCSQNTAIVTPATQTYTWTGANSSTIMTSNLNWTNTSTGIAGTAGSGAPTFNGTENIIIPGGLSYYPALVSNVKLYTLNIASGGSINLSSNVLIVGCNIFNSSGGQILYSTSNSSGITWGGTVLNQGFTGSTTAGTSQVGTMTVANTNASTGTVTINSGSLDVYSSLAMTTGNLAVTSPATLTLKSSATQSAAVGIIPSTCSITGLVNIERFITGNNSNSNRGYRLLSSPVNQNSATSNTSNTFSLSYIRDHTFNGISYAGAFTGSTTGVAGGFNNTSFGPTVYLWDERRLNDNFSYTSGKNIGLVKLTQNTFPTPNTVDLSNGTTSLAVPVGNGFELFFLGPSSRTNGSTATPPADAVLTAHGYLNQQNVTVNLWYTPNGGTTGKLSYTTGLTSGAGYNMVGNPYASTINLNSVLTGNNSATGIDNIYLLSAKNSPNQTFIAFTPNGTSAPLQGFAVSGEGFIVHAKGVNSSLTFTEAQKSPTTQLTGAGLIMSAPKSDQLTVNGTGLSTGAFKNDIAAAPFAAAQDALTGMYVKITKDSLTYNYCGVYFGGQWSAKFQEGDAIDFSGNAPSVMMASFSADGVRSAVKHFPDYRTQNQRIKLFAAGKTDGMYTLSLEGIRNIDTVNYKITLYDNYKRDSTDIGHYKSYAYNQTIADTASYGANRFVLGIAQLQGSKYKLATFTAQKANDGVLVNWHTLNEGSNYFFTLEKQQANGTDYSPVYNIQSNGGTNYSYTDKTPSKGNNIYRLKQVDLLGNITYAGPVSVYYDQNGNEGLFTVYPNPTAETLHINVTYGKTNTTASTYKLNIYDATGSLIMQKSSSNVNWSENVSQFKPGVYIVELKGDGGYLLGKAKFVKK